MGAGGKNEQDEEETDDDKEKLLQNRFANTVTKMQGKHGFD